MPRSVEQVVDELHNMMNRHGQPVMTVPWPKFQQLASERRTRQERLNDIQEEARDKYDLVVAYARSVLQIAHDRDFAPLV